jgi:outer membrane protein
LYGQMKTYLTILALGAALIISLGFLDETPAAEPLIREGEELTLERCLEIAVGNQPVIMQYLYTTQANEAQLGQAKAGYYPKLDATSSFTSYNAAKQTGDPAPPINTLYGYKYSDTNLILTQKIYDFGKREDNVAVARLNLASSRMDVEDQITAVVNSVKNAYYLVLKSKYSRDVYVDVRDQYRKQLDQAKLFFEAGKKPKYDVTNAEVFLSNADLKLIEAENDLSKALVSLNTAMGYPGPATYRIKEMKALESYRITEEEAIERANKNRQDLQSLLTQRAAAEKSVNLAKKDYFPSFDANAGYEFAGSQTPLAQGWTAGVTLNWNLFQGFSTQQGVQKALANMRVTEAKIANIKLQIRQDVKTALLNLKKAEESIANAKVQVRQATENMELATLRYQTGLGTTLDVTIATVNYSQAKQTHITSIYDYVTAQANLEKAMGAR